MLNEHPNIRYIRFSTTFKSRDLNLAEILEGVFTGNFHWKDKYIEFKMVKTEFSLRNCMISSVFAVSYQWLPYMVGLGTTVLEHTKKFSRQRPTSTMPWKNPGEFGLEPRHQIA